MRLGSKTNILYDMLGTVLTRPVSFDALDAVCHVGCHLRIARAEREQLIMKNVRYYTQIFTLANIITMIRIALIPVFVVIVLAPWPTWISNVEASLFFEGFQPFIAAVVFALLAVTDNVDGYLARSRNEVTTFGKFLDPLADKMLVAAALLALIQLDLLPAWVALVIIAREFLVSGLRMVASAEGLVIAASPLGKIKTVAQIGALLLFIISGSHYMDMLAAPFSQIFNDISWVIMSIALILTVLSMLNYFIKASAALGIPHRKPAGNTAKKKARGDSVKTYGIAANETRDAAAVAVTRNATETHNAAAVIELALSRGLSIGTAESCTGGLVAAALTDVSGASAVFKGAVVSYTDEVKENVLGVSREILVTDGAVSVRAAEAMAVAALETLDVDMSVSVTGFAGPDGGSPTAPLGTIYLARAQRDGECGSKRGGECSGERADECDSECGSERDSERDSVSGSECGSAGTVVCSKRYQLYGARDEIRNQAVALALESLLEGLRALPKD